MSIRTIVMLGTGAVGKSSITIQYVSHFFSYFYNPTIEDSFRSTIEIDNEVYPISILDTAGQEEYSSLRDSYIRSGNGFVLVYSIISKASFLEANGIREEIYRVLDKDPSEHIPLVLVGNKCDLEYDRQVSKEEVAELSQVWGIPFIECSAKEKININEIYETVMREILAAEKGEKNQSNDDDSSEEKNLMNGKISKRHKKSRKNSKERKGFKKSGCVIM